MGASASTTKEKRACSSSEPSAAELSDRTPARPEALILEARREYGWGAKKLLRVLAKRYPALDWPARSTINAILGRHGLLREDGDVVIGGRHPGAAPLETERPNQVWPADFKGQFKTRDGRYCFPLTVTDHFSRSLLLCQGLRVREDRGRQARRSDALFRRGRPARSDPHRQRRTVRVDGHSTG